MGTTIVEVRVIDDPRLTSGVAVSGVSGDGRRIVFATPVTSPGDLFLAVQTAATGPFPSGQ